MLYIHIQIIAYMFIYLSSFFINLYIYLLQFYSLLYIKSLMLRTYNKTYMPSFFNCSISRYGFGTWYQAVFLANFIYGFMPARSDEVSLVTGRFKGKNYHGQVILWWMLNTCECQCKKLRIICYRWCQRH